MGLFDEIAKSIIAVQMMPVLAEFERQRQEELQRSLEMPQCYITEISFYSKLRHSHRGSYSKYRRILHHR